jgi:hypothetical protein
MRTGLGSVLAQSNQKTNRISLEIMSESSENKKRKWSDEATPSLADVRADEHGAPDAESGNNVNTYSPFSARGPSRVRAQ